MRRPVVLGAVLALAAAAFAAAFAFRPRGERASPTHARAARAAAPRASAAPPDPRAWRGGGEPADVAPGVLARVATRRRAEAEPRDATAAPTPPDRGAESATPAPCGAGRKGAAGAERCDNGAQRIEAIEIEWDAGDDP